MPFVKICSNKHHSPSSEFVCSECGEAIGPGSLIEVDDGGIPVDGGPSVSAGPVPDPPDAPSSPSPNPELRTCACANPIPDKKAGTCQACGQTLRPQGFSDPPEGTQGGCDPMLLVLMPWGSKIILGDELMIGRATHDSRPSLSQQDRDQLQQKCDTVSRFHLLLRRQSGRLTIEDLGSLNGSFVDDRPIAAHKPTEISAPCEVRLGSQCTLKIQLQ